jgi:hypothetical protein
MTRAEMDGRQEALDRIAALAREHGFSTVEIAEALGGPGRSPDAGDRRRATLVRVLGYLGGTFVFAGVGVFIALQWGLMGPAARVVVTLGSGVAAFALAILASRDPRFERAAVPLFLVAAALEPTGMFVAFGEYGSGGDWRAANLITSATLSGQFGGAFAALRRGTLLFLVLFFTTLFWWGSFHLLDVDPGLTGVVIGGSLLCAAAGIARTEFGAITPPWYCVGAAAFLGGLFDLLEPTAFDVLFLGAAAGLVYASAALHSRTLLFVSTLAVLAYTSWFTAEHFADSIGWPVALIALGLMMIALSAAAFRIDRKYVRTRQPSSAGPPRGAL